MPDRVNITDPEFRFVEHDPIGRHQSDLRLADLATEPLDYDELKHWRRRLNDASQITLNARQRGRVTQFRVQPGTVTVNPTSGAIHGTDHDRTISDACVAMLGRCVGDGQPVCISLSVSTNSSSYIPVEQPVNV